ncbi:hypothetical protein NCC78_06835 [Micromonospora phytophila]|uniref:hypothetical protein n=1 Tax=Micromonospora phytophila TaxID=709888 RepID=UPI00202DE5F3|nr:hypothetical protein [Micromonospora phytophila]MCM0674404.1 hypothetical protein [Micromonospora phytophila]
MRAIRLEALQDSPTAFSTPLAEATAFSDAVWQQEAARETGSASSATFVATAEAGDWVGMAAAAPLAEVPATPTSTRSTSARRTAARLDPPLR